MSLAANKALIRSWIETGLNTGDWEVIDHFFGPLYAAPGISGIDALRQSLTKIRTAFPDLLVQVEELIAEDDRVMARLAYRGTHQGHLFQHPPSGRSLSWSGIAIYHIGGGRIVEEWAIWDQTFFFKLGGSL